MPAEFLSETKQVTRQGDNNFSVLREKYCQFRVLYPAKTFQEIDEGFFRHIQTERINPQRPVL